MDRIAPSRVGLVLVTEDWDHPRPPGRPHRPGCAAPAEDRRHTEEDGAPRMLGVVILFALGLVLGAIVGAWAW